MEKFIVRAKVVVSKDTVSLAKMFVLLVTVRLGETKADTEPFRQSSRCADLQRALRDLLKQLQMNRLSPSVWLLLRRRGRLRTKAHDAPDEKQNDQSINNLQVVVHEAQAHSEARNRLQSVYETHDLGKIASATQNLGY